MTVWHIPLWLSCPHAIGFLLGKEDRDALTWVTFSLPLGVIFLYNHPTNLQRDFSGRFLIHSTRLLSGT